MLFEFTPTETKRLNAEYTNQLADQRNIKTARLICSIYSEKTETKQIEDGKKYVEIIKGVLR
jgi:hypothetical protein